MTPPEQTIAFAIGGPIARADLPGLFERVGAEVEESGAEVALCDVSAARADAVTVEALARLKLATGRHGCRACLCNASPALVELVDFMGLHDVLSR
jgi:ABC-type transporter Mla MlaB component